MYIARLINPATGQMVEYDLGGFVPSGTMSPCFSTLQKLVPGARVCSPGRDGETQEIEPHRYVYSSTLTVWPMEQGPDGFVRRVEGAAVTLLRVVDCDYRLPEEV